MVVKHFLLRSFQPLLSSFFTFSWVFIAFWIIIFLSLLYLQYICQPESFVLHLFLHVGLISNQSSIWSAWVITRSLRLELSYLQVGAHGTGAWLPPIDEQVISMKLVTPMKGTIEVSKEKNPELFFLARCGLGGLGVVAEVTIQCVDRHELVEHTFVSNASEIRKNHK